MSIPVHGINPIELGQRLRFVREESNLTQASAASKAEISRTTLVAIEQGKRPIKNSELIVLTDLYGVTLNQLLRNEAVHVDLVPRFRKIGENADDGFENAIETLNDFVTAEVELENLLGIQRQFNLPPERPLLPGDVRKQAEIDANELRQRMGLGQGPIQNIFALLELEMGMRVYTHPLKNNISGLFAYDDSVGACVLINSSHRYERQIQTGIHELGHAISARRRPDVCHASFQHNSREERYAVAFGPSFLMPAHTLSRKFQEVRAGSSRLTRRHIIILANYFGCSRESLIRRLEDLNLVPEATWDWFQRNGGITDIQAAEVLGHDAFEKYHRPIGSAVRLETLAAQVLERDLLSEGQVAELLKIDRFKIRRLRLEGEDVAYNVD